MLSGLWMTWDNPLACGNKTGLGVPCHDLARGAEICSQINGWPRWRLRTPESGQLTRLPQRPGKLGR